MPFQIVAEKDKNFPWMDAERNFSWAKGLKLMAHWPAAQPNRGRTERSILWMKDLKLIA